MEKLVLGLMISFYAHNAFALTFEQFQELSPNQRIALITDDKDPFHYQAARWERRVLMGEKNWRWFQQQRLAEQNGYESAVRLSLRYVSLRQTYRAAPWKHEKVGLPAADPSIREEGEREQAKTAQTIAVAIPLLAAIAPTPEARI